MSEPASYLTLQRGTPVVDRFGVPVGAVERVLTLTGPYFDGIIVRTEAGSRFVDAPEVRRIRGDVVELSITRGDCEAPGLTTVDGVPEARWGRTEMTEDDIHDAIDALKRAYVDDLLDAHELGDRCEAAYEATTLDELQRLVPERD
ncbi:MAG: DUF1707 domain-containing protein [Actinobacteria bacterium]|nr:MAG: DUF1707 domain-containing protein [Actinomycetota bacterium]